MGLTAFSFEAAPTEAFVRLGYDAYRGDAAWIPPFEAAVRAQLAPGAVSCEQRRFLATVDGRPVARVLAARPEGLRDRDGGPVGAVGFFEATDDAAGLDVLGAALGWLRERGLERAWGPLNFDIWHGYRLMTRGFEQDRFLGEPYNPPRYPELFTRAGFRPRQTWNSFPLPVSALAELAGPGAESCRELRARGYRWEAFEPARFEEGLARLHEGLHATFAGFLGFTPLPLAEFRRVAGSLRPALDPRCSSFVYDEEGRLAAFATIFLDLAAAVRAMGGRSGLWPGLRFALRRGQARRRMMHLCGVLPAELARRSGLARAAFHDTLCRLQAAGAQDVLVTLVAEGNPIRRHCGEHARDARREYTLFEWNAA